MEKEQTVSNGSDVINRAEVRRRLVMCAKDNSYYWREIVKDPRVSEDALNEGAAVLEAWIRRKATSLTNKGKTIK
jgi:hypothetical protein